MSEWTLVEDRLPESQPGTWSAPVIVLMMTGDIFSASCMGDYWQRKRCMEDGDRVIAWMAIPKMP